MNIEIITKLLISRCDNYTDDKRKHNLSYYIEIVRWDFFSLFSIGSLIFWWEFAGEGGVRKKDKERRERAKSRSYQVIKRYG